MFSKSTKVVGIAAAAALALGLGITAPASAAVKGSSLANVAVSGSSSTTAPTKSTRTKAFTVTFDGPSGTYYAGKVSGSSVYPPTIKVHKKNKGVKSSRVVKPYVTSWPGGTPVSPASGFTVKFAVPKQVTPGVYKITFPVSRVVSGSVTTVSATKYLTVKASTKNSRALTGASGSAKAHKTFPAKLTAPNYQAGAKVTVYYKAKGTSKYKKVKTGKLKAGTSYSTAKIKIAAKYNVGGKGGRIKFKVGSVKYAPGYSKSFKLTVYRY
ncbi:MAG: hypothetical protein QM611_05520 [Microbacterium sp.]|uniref:hypothetical protein n=1 Tax=Microbacterium sp. TaxID=51671 RepID=UPI0039E345A8